MTISLRAILVLTVVVLAGPRLHGQTALKYQFKTGDTLYYDLMILQKGTTRGDDKEFSSQQKQVISMSWKVQSVDDKGAAKLALKFDRVKVSGEAAKESVEVSSDDKQEPAKEGAKGMYITAKAMAKIEASFTMTPQGEIDKVSIPASVLKEINAIPGAEMLADKFGPTTTWRPPSKTRRLLPGPAAAARA